MVVLTNRSRLQPQWIKWSSCREPHYQWTEWLLDFIFAFKQEFSSAREISCCGSSRHLQQFHQPANVGHSRLPNFKLERLFHSGSVIVNCSEINFTNILVGQQARQWTCRTRPALTMYPHGKCRAFRARCGLCQYTNSTLRQFNNNV